MGCFLGTKITVYGHQGSIDVDGQPTTIYAIDGVVLGSYTSPIIAPGLFTDGTLFFQSPDLSNANHTLVITMTNGTQPNRYYLDYLNYTASPLVSSLSISTSKGAPGMTALPSSSNVASISLQPSSFTPTSKGASSVTIQPNSASSGDTPSSSAFVETSRSISGSASLTPSQLTSVSNTSSSPTQVGPIIGGVLGGIAFFIAFASLLFICLKQRKRRTEHSCPRTEQIPGEFLWSYFDNVHSVVLQELRHSLHEKVEHYSPAVKRQIYRPILRT